MTFDVESSYTGAGLSVQLIAPGSSLGLGETAGIRVDLTVTSVTDQGSGMGGVLECRYRELDGAGAEPAAPTPTTRRTAPIPTPTTPATPAIAPRRRRLADRYRGHGRRDDRRRENRPR